MSSACAQVRTLERRSSGNIYERGAAALILFARGPGVISDRMTSRKAAISTGLAGGAVAKFGMAAAAGVGSVGWLFAAKALDRLANGVQVRAGA